MLRDIRHAARSVRRWRFGAVTAVLTLATGIGAATSLYALLHAVLSDAQIEDHGGPDLCVERDAWRRARAVVAQRLPDG